MKKIITLCLAIGLSAYAYSQDLTINTFSTETHTGAATINQDFTFPSDVSLYNQITMEIALTCPAGGCDPWDRYAHIKLVTLGGEKLEIGRYVTPYANDWCSWTIDVTEYREHLTDVVSLESFIETWSGGWDLTLDFHFFIGTPAYPYVAVQNLHTDYYMNYGDTLFNDIDIASRNVFVPANAEKVVFRITNTGHGQGNTQNAAEFSNMTHAIHVDSVEVAAQHLWNSDCNVNPCSPQSGTWQYSRAGWCPGQEIQGDDFDITSSTTPGEYSVWDYVLQPFFNDCSPYNINVNTGGLNCISGVTCADCNYNSNGHTEPNYKISMQAIFYSTTPITTARPAYPVKVLETINELAEFQIYPNPSNGIYTIESASSAESYNVYVMDVTGKNIRTAHCHGKSEVDISNSPNGIYFVTIENENTKTNHKLINLK